MTIAGSLGTELVLICLQASTDCQHRTRGNLVISLGKNQEGFFLPEKKNDL